MEDKRIDLNIILGVADNEIVVVEELGLGSVCLYTMEYVSPSEIERRNADDYVLDYYEDLWKEAVRTGETYKGLEDWADEVRNYEYGPYPGFDDSFQSDFESAMEGLTVEQTEQLYECVGADIDDKDDEFVCECRSCGQVDIMQDYELKLVSNEVLNKLQAFRDGKCTRDELLDVLYNNGLYEKEEIF